LNEAAWRRTHPRVPDGPANLAWLIRLAQIFIRGFLRKPYRVSHLLLEIPSHEKLAIPQLVHEGRFWSDSPTAARFPPSPKRYAAEVVRSGFIWCNFGIESSTTEGEHLEISSEQGDF
jgi:hypothetical protein